MQAWNQGMFFPSPTPSDYIWLPSPVTSPIPWFWGCPPYVSDPSPHRRPRPRPLLSHLRYCNSLAPAPDVISSSPSVPLSQETSHSTGLIMSQPPPPGPSTGHPTDNKFLHADSVQPPTSSFLCTRGNPVLYYSLSGGLLAHPEPLLSIFLQSRFSSHPTPNLCLLQSHSSQKVHPSSTKHFLSPQMEIISLPFNWWHTAYHPPHSASCGNGSCLSLHVWSS